MQLKSSVLPRASGVPWGVLTLLLIIYLYLLPGHTNKNLPSIMPRDMLRLSTKTP